MSFAKRAGTDIDIKGWEVYIMLILIERLPPQQLFNPSFHQAELTSIGYMSFVQRFHV